MKLTIVQLAQRIGAELVGEGSGQIKAVGPIESAGQEEVTFVKDKKRISELGECGAGAVIVGERIESLTKPQLIVENVDVALIEALNIFAPKLKHAIEGVDPTAKLGQNVRIGVGVSVGPGVVIDDEVEIGENSVIATGCKIGQNSKLGKNCRLDSNVVIYHNCCLGNNVIIQANSTVGSTGFGYSFINGAHKLIPHNGGVVIEDFVEIGANCCVDRAKFGNTIIGAGTKIDNLVQIAHNVVIGRCCLIVGQVGIAGSSKLGGGVVLGGQVGIIDHIEIGAGTMVGAQSCVFRSVAAGQKLFGTPAIESREALRIVGLMSRLPKIVEQLKQLSKRVKKIEGAKLGTKLRWAAGMAASIAAGIMIAFFFLPHIRIILDPHESKVERIVKEYQDGNDHFYVSASPYLEDLRVDKSLSIIGDLTKTSERIASDRKQSRDSFFLVSNKDLPKMKKIGTWKQLSIVREVTVAGEYFVLLSTETNGT